jgi:hypothetical protein
MTGAGHWAKVAQPGLTWGPAVVHWHIPLGVVQIHPWTYTSSKGEDIGDLSDSDCGPEPLRHLITIDQLDQLVEG